MSKFDQFRLLLWKNWKLQLRRPVITVLEILLPAMFCLIMLGLRTLSKPNVVNNSTMYPSYAIEGFPDDLVQKFKFGRSAVVGIAYTPNTAITTSIMNNAQTKMMSKTNATYYPIMQGLDTEDDLMTYVAFSNGSIKNSAIYLCGVVFQNSNYTTSLPRNITYKLRFNYYLRNASQETWRTQSVFPYLQNVGERNGGNPYNPIPGYYSEGFLAVQNAINRAIMEELEPSLLQNPEYNAMDMKAQVFPFPPYIKDSFITVLQVQLPIFLTLSLVFIALNIPREVVLEKERKLKEAMKMMGVNNWLHWMAWFAKYLLFLIITVGIMTVILCPPGRSVNSNYLILRYSDSSVIFVFLVLYAVTTICFCFMISVFFNKANSAAAAGGILFFLTYLPYMYINVNYDTMTMGTKLAWCINGNTAMSIGAYLIGKFEGTGEGVQWSNVQHPVSVDDDFTISYVLGMLLLDSLLYVLIMWYVEAIRPGDYGIPQKPYFPFLRSYWCGTKRDFVRSITPELANETTAKHSDANCEADPVGVSAGIQITGLKKVFINKGIKKVAVDNLSLSMYEGQITALLGHNGAGKTTTMFMLTGFMPPTSGTAIINGYDIREDIQGVRSSLGLCPQHDILFDNLTVDEHLEFFAKLKGCRPEKRKEEKDYYINALGLQEKRSAYAQTLSGGQKRKLSVAIALIGGSKIVILDEPTSGMDPSARRLLWDVLQKQRAGRTMLLSTHFMDEADNLGDRIAIMSQGVIQCCGSSLFLKNRFGAGYHMVMVKNTSCLVQNVFDVVQRHVPTSKLESNVGAELSFILPHDDVSAFPALFAELEDKKDELGIMSYGVSVTTMEEVFLKVGHGKQDEAAEEVSEPLQSVHHATSGKSIQRMDNALSIGYPEMKRNVGLSLTMQHFRAMITKRILYTFRNWILTLSQVIMPTVFTSVTAAILTIDGISSVQVALTLDMNQYGPTTVLYEKTAMSNFSNASTGLAESYVSRFPPSQNVSLVDNVGNSLIAVGNSSITAYTFRRAIAAAFFSQTNATGRASVTALFNPQPYHAAAVSLSYVSNSMLAYFVNTNYTLTTVNHPLPTTLEDQAADLASTFNGKPFFYSMDLMLGMSFLASSFVVFLIKERATKVKHSQFVSGVKWYNFWFATFVWDLINYLVPAVLVMIIFEAFNIKQLSGAQQAYLFVLLIMYGVALLPSMYVMQFLFSTPATGYVALTFYNVLSGILPNLVVTILDSQNQRDTSNALRWIFSILSPTYSLGEAMINLYSNYDYRDVCLNKFPKAYGNVSLDVICERAERFNQTSACCKSRPNVCGTSGCLSYTDSYYSWEPLGIGRLLFFLAMQCIVCWFIIFLIETDILRKAANRCQSKSIFAGTSANSGQVQDDEDVVAERSRLLPSPSPDTVRNSPVVIYGLTKHFKEQQAVNNLCVAIPRGECFGLLGVNGAGKTTTFKMLTGDETVSAGNAILNGHNVSTDILKVHQNIGYCPQFDALIDQMTGEETLHMFARLRGIPENIIPSVIKQLIEAFTLTPHATKLTEKYSGGNKRKLSTAIALIGDPPVVLLDEPTAGVDPVARRILWDSLSQVRASGKTLILTSHSMEECEALCTRMAIMVNGQFRCLGSTQHLKNKFGSGYSLVVRVSYPPQGVAPDLTPLITFIEETFPGSVLKDIHQNLVQYQIDSAGLSWSTIFDTMERAKAKFSIENYSVSQTTLEQVFLNFARSQVPPRENNERRGCSSLLANSLCGCCAPNIVVSENELTSHAVV